MVNRGEAVSKGYQLFRVDNDARKAMFYFYLLCERHRAGLGTGYILHDQNAMGLLGFRAPLVSGRLQSVDFIISETARFVDIRERRICAPGQDKR
jgi:hypothetical protein